MENASTLKPPSMDLSGILLLFLCQNTQSLKVQNMKIINTQFRQYKSVFFQETSGSMSTDMSQVNLN